MHVNTSAKAGLLALSALLVLAALPLAALAAEAAPSDPEATVFYFHGKRRCMTCRSIESTAEKVVREHFAGELESGRLAWRIVNFEEDANKHFVKDVGLAGSSVVVARVAEDGELSDTKILQKVWQYSSDEKRMRAYLVEEISDFLASGS